MHKRNLLLIILLDAFRHDYLRHTRYLQALARTSLTGRFREPFGFCPRAAYFGGIEPSQSGFTNMFWLDPANSPFSSARFLDLESVRSDPALQASARTFIQREARLKCTPFAASYISSISIPLQYLHMFDVPEKAAPWDLRVGYRSLFHALDEKGMPWFECSWPGYDGLINPSDRSILECALERIKGDHVLAFIHFSSLDQIGHIDGPGSQKCVTAIASLDGLVQRLVRHCSEWHNSVDLIVFGDHGMVSVAKNFDISQSLAGTGLTAGRDFHYFIDSTMVRFWCVTRSARRILEQQLATFHEGYIVDSLMQHELGIKDCDSRNGELIFMAHPGIQFFPNFFQASGPPPKGMHGYDPGSVDNQGFFLIHTDHRNQPARVITVNAKQIFHTCCDLLDLDNIDFDRKESALHERHRLPDEPRFTIAPNPEITGVVQKHLSVIAEEIRKTAVDAKAVILTGGFGRGEGSVIHTNGDFRPLNDYDLLVACDEGLRPALKVLGLVLARKLGIDYVDVGPLHPAWFDKLKLTLFSFDLKHGSRTIWGDESLLESVPAFAPAEIPLIEGYQLIQNRIAGLVLGLKPNMLASMEWTEIDSVFLIHQISKAAMAIGDFRLLALGDYCSSYRERLERILGIRRALDLGDAETQLLERAYSFKLLPDYGKLSPASSYLFLLLPHLKASVLFAIRRLLGIAEAEMTSLPDLLSLWEERYADSLGQEMTALRSSLVLLLFSIEKDFTLSPGMLQEAFSRYRIVKPDASPDTLHQLAGLDLYSELRSVLLRKWEDQCH